jgi:hypothetical protein
MGARSRRVFLLRGDQIAAPKIFKLEGFTMNLGMLQILTSEGRYILAEPAHPASEPKISLKISLRTTDGRELSELSLSDFNDFLREKVIEADGPADGRGRIAYRLSEIGRKAVIASHFGTPKTR